MRDVFLLGAGFSKAIDPLAMPSTDELGTQAVEVLKSIHASRQLGSKHSDVCDGLSCDGDLLVSGGIPARNFEAWMTKLAEPQPYLFSPANDRNHALFDELVGVIATEVEGAVWRTCEVDPPEWLL